MNDNPFITTVHATLRRLDSYSRNAFIAFILTGSPLPEGTKQTLMNFSLVRNDGTVPDSTVDAVVTLRQAGKI